MTERFDPAWPGADAEARDRAEMGTTELLGESAEEAHQSRRGDVPGAASWPVEEPPQAVPAATPPVGLNWTVVAHRLGIDVRILEHDGVIVLAGEYVPAPGFVIDPDTFLARSARVGDRVLYHSYFVGELTASEFHIQLSLDPDPGSVPNAVVRSASAPVIGLFGDRTSAERARRKIVDGSIGYGVSMQQGPLGAELRVARADDPGRVATVIASHRGAVISVGGASL